MDPVRAELAAGTRAFVLAAGLVLAASACGGAAGAEARASDAASSQPASGAAVQAQLPIDSILPMHVLLTRFREGLPITTALERGARSADDLVRRFVAAVSEGDTAALTDLTLTRAEYAWLYFPTSVYAAAPYALPPEIAWTLSAAVNAKGVDRVVRRLSGAPLRLNGWRCHQKSREGTNRFQRQCTVDYELAGEGRVSRRLFGTIMEREGRYKFLSYANDF